MENIEETQEFQECLSIRIESFKSEFRSQQEKEWSKLEMRKKEDEDYLAEQVDQLNSDRLQIENELDIKN